MSINISKSLIEEYLSCNRKVYYRLNRPLKMLPTKEMIMGDIVHRAIEKFWDDREKASEFVKENFLKYRNMNMDLDFYLKCVDTFFYKFYPLMSKTDKIETKFKIPIYKDVFIVGRLDRISNKKIFDWKTTRNPPSSVNNDVQFILYDWSYRQMYGHDPHGVYYASLSTGNLIKYKKDSFLEKMLIDKLIPELVSLIRKNNFVPNGIFNRSCYRCQYRETCHKELGKDVLDSSTFT